MDEVELRKWAVERYLDLVITVNRSLNDGPWIPSEGGLSRGADELYKYALDGTIPPRQTPESP